MVNVITNMLVVHLCLVETMSSTPWKHLPTLILTILVLMGSLADAKHYPITGNLALKVKKINIRKKGRTQKNSEPVIHPRWIASIPDTKSPRWMWYHLLCRHRRAWFLMELLLWKDHIKTRRDFWPCGPQQFQPQVWFSITLVNYIITVSHAPLRTLYMSVNSIREGGLLFSGIYSKYISHSSISKGAAKNLIPSQRWRLGLSLV